MHTKKMKNIKAKIVADTVNPKGKRITTFLVTYPRFIHAEIMTHRALSRNAASSRAIPIKKVIEAIKKNPVKPEWWGATQSGMQADCQLDESKIDECKDIWEDTMYEAIDRVSELDYLGLHKQIANRILEPWFHITVLITATDFDNFFALRAHKDTQPEFQVLAFRMLDKYLKNVPRSVCWGDWHLPFVEPGGCTLFELDDRITQSVASAARTSYTTQSDEFPLDKQKALVDRLAELGHWSPFEHQAQAIGTASRSGNFSGGWDQLRQKYQRQDQLDKVDLESIMNSKPTWFSL